MYFEQKKIVDQILIYKKKHVFSKMEMQVDLLLLIIHHIVWLVGWFIMSLMLVMMLDPQTSGCQEVHSLEQFISRTPELDSNNGFCLPQFFSLLFTNLSKSFPMQLSR